MSKKPNRIVVALLKSTLYMVEFSFFCLIHRLQGNQQVCNLIAYQNTYCSRNLSGSVIFDSPPAPTPCSNVCPDTYLPSPIDNCSCVLPYKGLLIFRAPLFTTLENTSHFQELILYIADHLKISQSQVDITSAYFNAQNQLLVAISIFPNIGTSAWSRDHVIQFSYALGNKGIHINIFGPPLFIQDPYSYDGESSLSHHAHEKLESQTSLKMGKCWHSFFSECG